MRIDSLQQFVKLRRELTQEKEQITRRLAQIDEALGETTTSTPTASLSAVQGASPAGAGSTGRRGRIPGGGTSLRQIVMQLLSEGPKTKEEILDLVRRSGYKFQTKNPLNSLGVILYGKNPRFNRVDGRFSLPGGATGAAGGGATGGRRQMSAAARARIAEAQRKRWAATRKGNGDGDMGRAGAANGVQKTAKRTMSAAARKAIAEAARKRWAAAKAAGRTSL